MEARYECPLYHGGYDLIGDGNIGLNPGWADAPWSSDFVDIRGGNAPVPRFRTRMKMMWEERGLYVGAEIQDPELYATQTERNSFLWQYDNDFEVKIPVRFHPPSSPSNETAKEKQKNFLLPKLSQFALP